VMVDDPDIEPVDTHRECESGGDHEGISACSLLRHLRVVVWCHLCVIQTFMKSGSCMKFGPPKSRKHNFVGSISRDTVVESWRFLTVKYSFSCPCTDSIKYPDEYDGHR
jgi:hypothetical protein